MFTKLLKHEFRSTWSIIGTLCLVCLGCGLLSGLSMCYLVRVSEQGAEEMWGLTLLCVLVMVVGIIAIAVCGVAALFVLIGRFYKRCFTDEGYLTFTLPVNSHQILLSSMVNSVINMLIASVTVFVSIALLILVGVSSAHGFWPALWESLPRLFRDLCQLLTSREMGYVVHALLWMLLFLLCELVVLMLSVTIGALAAKKHKILAAVGVYYIIHFVTTFINLSGMGTVVLVEAGTEAMGTKMITVQTFVTVGIALAGYFIMHYLITKKLNLP